MYTRKLSIALLSLTFAPLPLFADRISMLSPDSTSIVTALDADTPDGEDGLPRHFIIGNNKFYLGIGGYGKVTIGEDFGVADMSPSNFTVSEIPTGGTSSPKSFNISPAQTYLFLNFVGLPDTADEIGFYIGANLTGKNYLPNLIAAHIKYRGIKLGYDYPVFSDNTVLPGTIDYQGPNAACCVQMPELSYSCKFGKNRNWEVQAGITVSPASMTFAAETAEVKQFIPDFAAALRFTWGDDASLKLAGLLHNMTYRNLVTGKDVTKCGWGAMLSGKSPVAGNLSAGWSAVIGKGVASYIQDLADIGYDLMPSSIHNDKLTAPFTWGAYGWLQYDFSEKFSLAACYSHVRNHFSHYEDASDEQEFSWDSRYRYAQYVSGTFTYNIMPNLVTGLEYIYGRRVDMDGAQGHASRLQTMLQVFF